MPSTSPPVGPDNPGGPPLKDEQAFERLFRQRYTSLAAMAKTHLKDASAAAPHLVESMFRQAWDQRAQFKSIQELDAFFEAEVPHAAARELARRASAHHFGAGGKQAAAHAEPTLDVNQSWERIQRTLHPDREAAGGAMQSASRHEAASHVKGLAKKRNYTVPVIIVLVAIAAAFGISKYLNRLGQEGGIITALNANIDKAHQTRDNQIANISDLADGSSVKMGPDSKVVVADGFSGDKMRVIQVQGTAQITVAPGQKEPFQVRAFNAVVNAPDGTILIRTYDDDSSVTVIAKGTADSLRMGKVWRPLAAGAAMHIGHDGTVGDATPGQFLEASTWVNDTVSIANRTLQDAVDQLQQWYGTKVVVLDSTLLTRPVTIQAPMSSATAAIAAIEKSANVKFGYEGQGMVFRDAEQKR
ncbi:MAG: FecR domain-containing protein [Gemmatimonadaceae bacterium]